VTASSQPAIEDLARKLGVAVYLSPPNADGSYTVDHAGAILVVDPDGRLADPHRAVHRGALQSDLGASWLCAMSGDDSRRPPAGSAACAPGCSSRCSTVAAAWIVALGPLGHRVRTPWFKNSLIRAF